MFRSSVTPIVIADRTARRERRYRRLAQRQVHASHSPRVVLTAST